RTNGGQDPSFLIRRWAVRRNISGVAATPPSVVPEWTAGRTVETCWVLPRPPEGRRRRGRRRESLRRVGSIRPFETLHSPKKSPKRRPASATPIDRGNHKRVRCLTPPGCRGVYCCGGSITTHSARTLGR